MKAPSKVSRRKFLSGTVAGAATTGAPVAAQTKGRPLLQP
jgi:hypothetical protein